MKKLFLVFIVIVISYITTDASATTLTFSKDSDLVGSVQAAVIHKGDDFIKIARKYDVGYYQLIEANPGIDPDKPQIGTVLIIPSEYILPRALRRGIIINLAELRLYYFPKGKPIVMTYPLGIGRQGWSTPLGRHKIVQKVKNPTWYVPKSIRTWRKEEDGTILPDKVPPGPDNPLGKYMMRLSAWTYLIHGTNNPAGVGRRTSSGCLRMFPEDIAELYHLTSVGTRVNIIDVPYKLGWKRYKLYVESHLPLQEMQKAINGHYDAVIKAAIDKAVRGKKIAINWRKALNVAREEQGLPQQIGSGY